MCHAEDEEVERMRLGMGYFGREWLVKGIFIVYVIYSGGFILWRIGGT